MKIADVFFRALLDDSTLKVDAVKVGNTAGETMGKSMSSRIKANLGTALRTGALAAFGGAAAVATKGLLQLEDIQARLQAETGATADEAEKAGKAINEIAGRNLQSLGQVGDAFIEVSKQMQLTGDAAARMTEEILKFSTATGTDAVENVKHLDNVLDAWNLTADDAAGLMDKLVVGQQRFGGSVSSNIIALKDYAPQLQALGASVDDALGLLNLFAQAGLDATSATRALNTAVKNLKPGENLDTLVAKLTAIKDPTDRAKEAIRLFGARGGVALANALQPGIAGLQDFQISASDAAGATDRAASKIEGTFGARFQLAMKAATAAVIGFGQSFGPAVTGIVSVAAILSATPLGGIVAKAFGGIAGIAKEAALKTGAILAGYFSTGFGIAQKIGAAVVSGLTAIAERTGVKSIAVKAGALIGSIFASAMKMAEAISGAVSDAFLKLPFIPALRSAVLASAIQIGTLQGTAIATAASVALAGAALVLPVLLIPQIPDIQKWLNEHNPFSDQAGKDAVAGFTQHMNDVANGAGQDAGKSLVEGMKQGALDTSSDVGIGVGGQVATAFGVGLNAQSDFVVKTFNTWIGQMGVNWQKFAHVQGNLMGADVAKGIVDKRDAVDKAWQDLLDMIKNSVTPTHERAKLLGELVSTTLAKALHDKRPDVAAQARFTKQTIIDRLDELKANATNIGKDGMDLLRKGMKSKDADIRAESTAIYKAATSSTKNLPATGTAEGSAFTHNVATGMTSQSALQDIKDASQTITRIAHLYVHTASPAKLGPWSEDGGPEAWGRRFTTLLAKGIAGGVPDVHAAFNGLRRPNLAASLAFPHAGSVAGAGHTFATSSTVASNHVTIGEVHVHGVGSDVSPGAAKRFGQQIVDEMGKTFRQQGARIGLHPAVVP